jgi:plasmid stabilization system protein ParE
LKLCWRPAAEADRLAIYDHIEADNRKQPSSSMSGFSLES